MKPNKRILIIDDEASLRHTLARILQRAGFEETVTAATAGEGVSMLAAQEFGLVCLDIRLPDMSGLQALKTIRSLRPNLPVILFTAQPDMQSAVEAVRLGAADYLLKPIKPEALLERTRAILTRAAKEHRRREIQSQIEALQTELKKLEEEETPPEGALPLSVQKGGGRFLSRGRLTLDLHARRVLLGDRVVNLPPTAFDYLLVLARHAPNVVDYQTMAAEAQGYHVGPREAQELIKWHIHHIRRVLEPDTRRPVFVINVRGRGYRLVTD